LELNVPKCWEQIASHDLGITFMRLGRDFGLNGIDPKLKTLPDVDPTWINVLSSINTTQ
jgi:hypothetical protein